jgi:hypothetical protein
VRAQQTTSALTPDLCAPVPTPLTAAEIAAAREERIETAVRSNAEIFRLKSELTYEEKIHAQERADMQEQVRLLRSRAERFEQDIIGLNSLYHSWANPESERTRMKNLLELVRDGEFCANSVAPPAEIRQEAADKLERISQCQSQ